MNLDAADGEIGVDFVRWVASGSITVASRSEAVSSVGCSAVLVVVKRAGEVVAELLPCLWRLTILMASLKEYFSLGDPLWSGLSRRTSLLALAVATFRRLLADPHSGPV